MSIKEVKSTAQKVIDNHSAQLASTAASEKQSDESKVTERLVARAHSDGTDTVQLATQATGGSGKSYNFLRADVMLFGFQLQQLLRMAREGLRCLRLA